MCEGVDRSDGANDRDSAWVQEQIDRNNDWYVSSQFAWAERPEIRRIYERRIEFIGDCVRRAQERCGSPLRVLDAGCGDGYWLTQLRQIPGLELVGIDYNPLRVERAAAAVPEARVQCHNLLEAEGLGRFHLILLSHVIEHVVDDVGLLRRLRLALHPTGVLVLGTPNEGCLLQLPRGKSRAATDHIHFYREAVIRQRMREAGFEVSSVFREVFYIGTDRLYYRMTRSAAGFRVLEWLTRVFPSGCSGYYFECRPSEA